MMTYNSVSKEQVKKHAQVFTPAGVVFEMILNDGIRELVMDVDKTVLDPAAGEGQFPCAELVCKMFYNLDTLDEETALRALASLYGIDIQSSAIATTKTHLKATLADTYKFFTGKDFPLTDYEPLIDSILEENLIVGDSLEIMNKWAAPQQSLF